jgi:hypothetical protein
MTIVKKAPRKVTKAIESSFVGQKISDAGTHASGGIGRKISNGAKKMSRKYGLTASARPKGMPMICAVRKPVRTRVKLRYQLSQYPHFGRMSAQAAITSVGGGMKPMNGSRNPNHSSQREPISHRISTITIAAKPRQKVLLATSFCRPLGLDGRCRAALRAAYSIQSSPRV